MANRNLPELRSRLRLDTSDLDKATVKARAFTGSFNGKISTAGLDDFSRKADRLGSKLTRNVTLPVLAAGAASVKLAVDFNTSFNQMQTLAGVTAGEVDGLKDAVKKLAVETGRSPDELAKALYFIRSSGVDGARALDVLDASAKGAAIGLGDAASVADAVTSAMNTYSAEGLTAAQVTDQLSAAVQQGKGEAAEFAPQLGRLLPVAQNLGISFDQVSGALAFLTQTSGDTAQSSTQLFGILQKLVKPSQQSADVLSSVGLSADALRKSVREDGLIATLQLLDNALGHDSDALGKVFEDSEGLTGVLGLLRNGGKDAAATIDNVTGSTGFLDKAFAKIKGSDALKLQQDLAKLSVAAVDIGNKILPALAGVADSVSEIVGAFASLPQPVQTGLLALIGTAAALGPLIKGLSLASTGLKALLKAGEAVKGLDLSGAIGNAGPAIKQASDAIGGLATVVPAAAGALGVLGLAYLEVSGKAERAGENVKALNADIAAGESPAEAFNRRLANTLSGTSGGFSLNIKGDTFRQLVKDAGLSAKELQKILLGSDEDFQKFIDDAYGGNNAALARLAPTLVSLRGSAEKSKTQTKDLAHNEKELGVETSGATSAVDDQAGSLDGLIGPSGLATDALEEQAKAAADLFDAHQQETQTAKAVADAQSDVAEARRSGAEAVEQATKAVTDAEQALADAQVNSRKAQEDLSKARVEAAKKIEDLTRASKDARLEADSAAIDLAEAKRTLQEGNFDGPIEQARAELAVRQAAQKLEDQNAAAAQAATDAADAQRKGVAGSDEVLAAQERITSAADAEREARERVGEATAAVSKAQTDAASKVREAEERVTEAQLAHVEAQAALAEKTGDAGDATDVLIVGLTGLAQTLDPNDPLRKNLTSYIADLQALHDLMDGNGPGPGVTNAIPPTRDPDQGPSAPRVRGASLRNPSSVTGPGRSLVPAGATGSSIHLEQHLQVIGDPDAVALAKMKEVASAAVSEGLRKAAFR